MHPHRKQTHVSAGDCGPDPARRTGRDHLTWSWPGFPRGWLPRLVTEHLAGPVLGQTDKQREQEQETEMVQRGGRVGGRHPREPAGKVTHRQGRLQPHGGPSAIHKSPQRRDPRPRSQSQRTTGLGSESILGTGRLPASSSTCRDHRWWRPVFQKLPGHSPPPPSSRVEVGSPLPAQPEASGECQRAAMLYEVPP